MPSQTIGTVPGCVTALAAFWVALGPCSGQSSWPVCDNGKVLLDTDLPKDTVPWDCPTPLWTESQNLCSVDTVYDSEPAKLTCMDQHITYNHTIPNSGTFRPVRAESGEYLFCPPQRWLNNLQHGATVLLYHPCSPLVERRLLSALAQLCLSDYILTPHTDLDKSRPIAFVSWGRTLEVSTAAAPSEICDWLNTTSPKKAKAGEITSKHQYNHFLTRSAKQDKENKGSLKQCCEQVLHSSFKTRSLKQIEERVKRAAIKSTTDLSQISSNPSSKVIHKLQSKEGISSQNTADESSAKSESMSLKGNPLLKDSTKYENNTRTTADNLPSIRPQVQSQKSNTDKMEQAEVLKHRGKGPATGSANLKENELIDVEEREAGNMNSASNDSSLKPICRCKGEQPCECNKAAAAATDQSGAAAGVKGGFQRTPRTDEAVWAAGALGFLLVLLTLSILHTRLYKHWRRGTSLYWHDPRQDYDSVADVIRRRLRLAKKRRKRSRKKECVLLPSSSSSEEYP